ncbi:MAG TPA: rhomboid family intramembrane serine protease [Gaiellales bacterium]|jgi:membrane associated rhomboid family serine protease
MSETEQTCYRHPDRPTLVRCSRCERPICPDCMRPAPVGIHCPECAGEARGPFALPKLYGGSQPVATISLIALNVVVFLLERGGDSNTYVFRHGALTGVGVADGQWWRVATAAFLHANILHIAFNMYALWLLGRALERYIGTWRFLAIYAVAGISGSAGALLLTNAYTPTVGASGAIFGLMGALLLLERRGTPLVGPLLPILAINLVFTLSVSGISIGGHIGGLIGGLLAALALEQFGRGHLAYGRLGLLAPLMLVGILVLDSGLIWYAVR